MGGGQLWLVLTNQWLNVLAFYKTVVKPLVTLNCAWQEYSHHENCELPIGPPVYQHPSMLEREAARITVTAIWTFSKETQVLED